MRKTYIIRPDSTEIYPPAEPCPLRVRSVRGFHLVKRRVFLPKFRTIYKQAIDQGCSFPEATYQTSPQCIANVDTRPIARNKINSVTVLNPGIGFTAIPKVVIQDSQLVGRNAVTIAKLALCLVEIRQAGQDYGLEPVFTFEVNSNVSMLVEPELEPVIENGIFTSVRILNPGLFADLTPHTATPLDFKIVVTDDTGTDVRLKGYFCLQEVEVLSEGYNYQNPKVLVDEASRTDVPDQEADATANLSDEDGIESVVVRRGGMGFRISPQVEIEDEEGTDAQVRSQLEAFQIQILTAGTNYERPRVTITGGGYTIKFGGPDDEELGFIYRDSLGIITHIVLLERGLFTSQPDILIEESGDGLNGPGSGATALVTTTIRNFLVEDPGVDYVEPTVTIDSPENALIRSDRARQFLVKFNGNSKKYPELKRLYETPLKGSMTISEGSLVEDDPANNRQTFEFNATGGSSFFYHTKKYDVTSYGNLTYKVRAVWDTVLEEFLDATLEDFHFSTNITMFDNIHMTSISFDFYLPPGLGEGCLDVFIPTDYCLHFYENPVDNGNPEDPEYKPPARIPEKYKPFLVVAKLVPAPRLLPIFQRVYGIDSIEVRERKVVV